MGAFTDLFGYIPRVKVLEAFAENPGEALSAPDVERITDVSRRAAYLIIRRYVEAGVIVPVESPGAFPRRFQLNQNDLRAQTLWGMEHILTLGGLQAEIKRVRGIPFSEQLPAGSVTRIPRIAFIVDWTQKTSSSRFGLGTISTVLSDVSGRQGAPVALHSTVMAEGLTQFVLPYTEVGKTPSEA